MRTIWAALTLSFAVAGCAVIPGDRPRETPPSGLEWFHRLADSTNAEAALWGPPQSEAQLMIRCARGGAEIVQPGDRPTTPWRLAAGAARMTADPRFEADGYGLEVADVAANHPLLAVLADTGGPLRLSTAAGELILPASPIVARVAAACRR